MASLKPPSILTAIGGLGMTLCVLSCGIASHSPGGSDKATTYGLWGTLGFIPAALLFACGLLWLIIAAATRK